MTDTEIVQCFANGDTTSQIAFKSGYTKRTIERKIEILKFKTSSRNIVHLACIYLNKGLIKLEFSNG